MLKAFNKLLYNYEVGKLLIARFLLDLLDHYTPQAPIKSINIFGLKIKFPLLIFRQNFNTINNNLYVNDSKMQPYSIFKYHHYKDLCILELLLYQYYRLILVVKCEQKQERDYKFDDTHI